MRPQTTHSAAMFRIMLMSLACSVLMVAVAHSQTFTVLHAFDGGQGGANPAAGPTFDRGGNLYGTTSFGGAHSYGLVYKLSHVGSGWILTPLYSFRSQEDGAEPGSGSLVIGPDGSLFGSTRRAGQHGGGTVYNLRPPSHPCPTISCPWTITVLHAFGGAGDGAEPEGRLVFDAAGNLYGTTYEGGAGGCDFPGCGIVFKLTPSGGGWTETILYSFMGGNDGMFPANVTMDAAGNIYGVTEQGGSFYSGTVFKLSPSGSGYTKSLIYLFNPNNPNDGIEPTSVTLDSAGNLIGGTVFGGTSNNGVAFKLSYSNGGWIYTDLHDFTNGYQENYNGPANVMTIDAAGNIYGTTQGTGSYSVGLAFELTFSNGGYTYVDLHDFTGGEDGEVPTGAVVLDSAGNVYSTVLGEGPAGYGDIWEITP